MELSQHFFFLKSPTVCDPQVTEHTVYFLGQLLVHVQAAWLLGSSSQDHETPQTHSIPFKCWPLSELAWPGQSSRQGRHRYSPWPLLTFPRYLSQAALSSIQVGTIDLITSAEKHNVGKRKESSKTLGWQQRGEEDGLSRRQACCLGSKCQS